VFMGLTSWYFYVVTANHADWERRHSDLYCDVSSSDLGHNADSLKWFCCGSAQQLKADAMSVRCVVP
jgi:hypothetical protein